MIDCAFRVGATEAYVLTIAPHADVSAMSGPKNLIWSPADKSANTPFFKENKSNMPAFWAQPLSYWFILEDGVPRDM